MSLIDYNDFIKYYLEIPLEDINADYKCYFCGGEITHAWNNANIQVILCCSDCYFRLEGKNNREKRTDKLINEKLEEGHTMSIKGSEIIL